MSSNDPARLQSRRAFLSGSAALAAPVALAPVAVAATVAGNPELPVLIARHAEAKAAADRADDLSKAAADRWRAFGILLEPDALFARETDRDLCLYGAKCRGEAQGWRAAYGDVYIEHLRKVPRIRVSDMRRPVVPEDSLPADAEWFAWTVKEPWPEAQARADEIVAAHDAYLAELARRREVSGLNAAQAVSRQAWDAVYAATVAVRNARARTLDDLIIKARFVVAEFGSTETARECMIDNGHGWESQFSFALVLDLHAMGEA